MKRSVFARALLASVCGMAISTAAHAQDSADEEKFSEDEGIVVTAQNRSENVQDVPISISVVSGEALQNAGVTDLRELERVAPALQITQDQQNTYVAIRGIGTSSNNETQDTSVTLNIDGEYINRTTVLNAALFDIERVEALRGPQGTLYGRNATAGAVNFITRKPDFEFGANASASYGNYDQIVVNAGVDVPLGDTFAIRVSGVYANRDKGYAFHPNAATFRATNPLAGKPFTPVFRDRSGTQDQKAGRLSLRFEPTDALRVDAAVEYADSFSYIQNYQYVNLNAAGNTPGAGCAQNGYIEIAPLIAGDQCFPINTNFFAGANRASYDGPVTGTGTASMESLAFRGRISYDFGPLTATYIGGYRDVDSKDNTALPVAFYFIDFGSNVKTQSHELRFNGGGDGLQYQFGAFYYNEKLRSERGLYGPLIAANGSFVNYFRRTPVESESWSVFGQVDIPLGDTLTAQAGLRYTEGTRNAVFENFPFQFNSGPTRRTTAAPTVLLLDQSEDNISWLAGLNYTPNSDTLIYAKVSTGFKGGGFDAVGDYGPEKNTAYEVGTKLNFGDNSQHLFNLSGFYYDYRGLQNSVLLNNAVGGQIFNAGKATIYGVEAEWKIQLDPNNRFTGSFNYLNAKFDDLLAAYAVVCVGCGLSSVGDLDPVTAGVQQPNLAGNRVPRSPSVIINLGYDHIFDLGSTGTLTASINSAFKSKYYLTIFNERDLQQKAYTQTDFSLTYRPESEKFSVAAFVQNIENTRAAVFGAFVAAGAERNLNRGYSRPRTYGVRVGFDF